MASLVERLREHATDWDGRQMPDAEPAKGDPTAGTLRQAADRITTLEAELAAMKARGDRLAEALGPFAAMAAAYDPDDGDGAQWAFASRPTICQVRIARQALTEWRNQ